MAFHSRYWIRLRQSELASSWHLTGFGEVKRRVVIETEGRFDESRRSPGTAYFPTMLRIAGTLACFAHFWLGAAATKSPSSQLAAAFRL
jgi:hypothetical protein